MAVTYRKRGPGRSGSIRSSSQLTDPGAGLVYDASGRAVSNPDTYVGMLYDENGNPWTDTVNVMEPRRSFIPENETQADLLEGTGRRAPIVNPDGTPDHYGGGTPDWLDNDASQFFAPGGGSGRGPLEDFSGYADSAWSKWLDEITGQNLEAERQFAAGQREIDLKEEALRQAMLDNDVEKVNRLIAEIAAMKEQMRSGFRDYRRLLDPVFERAIANNEQLYERNEPAFTKIAQDAQQGVADAYSEAGQATEDLATLIGAGGEATSAAAGIVGELEGLYDESIRGRLDDNLNLLQALENAGVTGSKATMVMDQWRKARQQEVSDKRYDDMAEAANDRLKELQYAQEALALDRERNKQLYEETMRRLSENRETPYIDAVGFGQMTAFTYLSDKLDEMGVPADRQAYLQAIIKEAWDSAHFESDQFYNWITSTVEGSDGQSGPLWQIYGLSTEELNVLLGAQGAYVTGRNQYDTLSSSHTASMGDASSVASWKKTTSNGRIPGSQLTTIPPPAGVGGAAVQLAPMAASAWSRMVAAALEDGVRIQAGGSYRTYETQVQLAKPPSQGGKGLYGVNYNGVIGLAARPGTSNHGYGLAVDIIQNGAAVAWLRANAGRFGFRTIPREPWHWEYRGS